MKRRTVEKQYKTKKDAQQSSLAWETVLVHARPDDGTLEILRPFTSKIGNIHIIDMDAPDPISPIPPTTKTVIVVTTDHVLELTAKFNLFDRIYVRNIDALKDLLFALKPYEEYEHEFESESETEFESRGREKIQI